ncbi:MAG: hypothetical protein HOQ24_14340 [Mycobacteriaceae bacterium]|nr:hypothetical protein [Mycobacteriaceae bacterium]
MEQWERDAPGEKPEGWDDPTRPHLLDYFGKPTTVPEVDDEARQWARGHPGEWRYYLDPFADKTQLSGSNVIGGRLAGGEGEFERLWVNPDFVPSAEYHQGARLDHALDLALWRTIANHNTIGDFIGLLAESEVIALLPADDPTGQRGWPARTEGEYEVIDIFTSPDRLPADSDPELRRTFGGDQLLDTYCRAKTTAVWFNGPGGWPAIRLRGADLYLWWQEYQWARRRLAAKVAEAAGGPGSDDDAPR